MNERLLGSRDDVTAVRGTERARCAVRWWTESDRGPYGVQATGPWGTARALARDLQAALRDVRGQLEGSGWLLSVNGARPDVRQSGMVAGSGTDLAYVLRPGEPADADSMVSLFADAPVEDVLPLAEQDAAYAALVGGPPRTPDRAPSQPAPEARREPSPEGARPEPPLTEELRARARQAPGTWLYSIDPMYDPAGEVPPFAIAGAWQVDDRGEPGPFRHNPDYRPSPVTLGLPRPTDAVDAALQLAATGHGPEANVVRALATATVYLPQEGPDLAVYTDEQGRFVPVLTDPAHAPATVPGLREVACADLLRLLPDDLLLKLNPGSRVSVRIPVPDVRAAVQGR
ncbi:type VII secretion system-associated protein [Streptomyces sp. NPDC001941]|uniref:type VII secretion system-associated protein n=1 Tax=Streptomyces sp. NPDC001941 TaxID=3154659 RepID=UPI0033175572